MSDLQELYQQVIMEHGRNPRNFGELPNADYQHEGYNPLCGDRVIVYFQGDEEVIRSARFTGSGCVISVASASLMLEGIVGKTRGEIKSLFATFHDLLLGKEVDTSSIGKLAAFSGVSTFPMRVKCASLCWHTALAALNRSNEFVSTE